MTSLIAVPLQLLSITCEVLFILENKVRIQKVAFNVPPLKCDAIMEDVLGNVLSKVRPEKMFGLRKAMNLEELRRYFQVVEHESLSFEGHSFEKLFQAACMAVKTQLVRLQTPDDLLAIFQRKMILLAQLYNNPVIIEDINRKRNALSVFYRSACPAEISQVRASILNSLRSVCVPVSVLIDQGIQLDSGHAIPFKTGLNARNLGLFRRFSNGIVSFEERRFKASEVEAACNNFHDPVNAENLSIPSCHKRNVLSHSFSADRITGSFYRDGEDNSNEEEYFNMLSDIGDDILFTSGAASSTRASFRSSYTSSH